MKEPTKEQLVRMVRAAMRIVDRHCETKEGSQLLSVPLTPQEMYTLRSSLEPFRALVKAFERGERLLARPEVTVNCPKCSGAGWLWWNELDEYHGPAVSTGIDDTKYSCDHPIHGPRHR